jgi:hypothetical protein
MEEIFAYAVLHREKPLQYFVAKTPSVFQTDKGPWALGRVSRRWRYIVLHTPDAWANVYLPVDINASDKELERHLALLRLFLDRSTNRLIRVLLDVHGPAEPKYFNQRPSKIGLPAAQRIYGTTMEPIHIGDHRLILPILKSSTRWRSFFFWSNCTLAVKTFDAVHSKVPHLRTIFLAGHWSGDDGSGKRITSFAMAPSLLIFRNLGRWGDADEFDFSKDQVIVEYPRAQTEAFDKSILAQFRGKVHDQFRDAGALRIGEDVLLGV